MRMSVQSQPERSRQASGEAESEVQQGPQPARTVYCDVGERVVLVVEAQSGLQWLPPTYLPLEPQPQHQRPPPPPPPMTLPSKPLMPLLCCCCPPPPITPLRIPANPLCCGSGLPPPPSRPPSSLLPIEEESDLFPMRLPNNFIASIKLLPLKDDKCGLESCSGIGELSPVSKFSGLGM